MPEGILEQISHEHLQPLLPQARRSGAEAKAIRDEFANYFYQLRNNA